MLVRWSLPHLLFHCHPFPGGHRQLQPVSRTCFSPDYLVFPGLASKLQHSPFVVGQHMTTDVHWKQK